MKLSEFLIFHDTHIQITATPPTSELPNTPIFYARVPLLYLKRGEANNPLFGIGKTPESAVISFVTRWNEAVDDPSCTLLYQSVPHIKVKLEVDT